MNKSLLLVFCLLLLGGASLRAQTPYYNQFHQLPLLNNPAAPAMSSEIQVNLGYKSVNVGSGAGVLNTPVFGFIYPIFQRNKRDTARIGYAGLTVLSDRTGANGLVNTTGAMASFAYNLLLSSSSRFSVGMHLGYFNRNIDLTRFATGNQWSSNSGKFDNTLPNGETGFTTDSRNYPLVNLGVMYFEEDEYAENNYYIGFSAQNLNRPITSFYGSSSIDKLPINFNLTMGTTINKNRQVFYTPNLRYIFLASGARQLNVGTLVHYRLKGGWGTIGHGSLGLGAWYSQDNAVITSIELNQPGFNVAFSYDWFTNQMNKAPSSARTTEVVVTLKKFIGKHRPTPNYYARAIKQEPTPKEEAPKEVKKPVETPKVIDTVKAVVPTAPVDTAKPEAPKKVPVAPVVEPEKPKEVPAAVTEPAKVDEPAKPVKAPIKKATPKKKPARKKVTPKKKPAAKRPVVKKEPVVEETSQPEVSGTTTPVISKQEASYIEDVIQPQYSFNNANLKEEAVNELDSLIQIMNKYPTVKLEVQGHSCNIGTVADNLTLSQRRAEKAVDYLTTRGITADRLVVKAIGKAKPKVPNISENNRIINRRVEFRILEK